MRSVLDKRRENQNKFLVQYLFSENCAVHAIMWKNMVEPNSPHMTM